MIVYTGLVSSLAPLGVPSAPRTLALAVIVPCGFADAFFAFFGRALAAVRGTVEGNAGAAGDGSVAAPAH